MVVAGRPSPLIPLGVGYQGIWQRVQAYVDSGAFYSIFKPALADTLGLDWQRGDRVNVQVGDGGFMLLYLHTVTLQLGRYRFTGQIGFSAQLGVHFNVLGRSPFFQHFIICFDDRHNTVRFEPYEEVV
jgi:hypothetical protein